MMAGDRGRGEHLLERKNMIPYFKDYELLGSWDDYMSLEKGVNSRIFMNIFSIKCR